MIDSLEGRAGSAQTLQSGFPCHVMFDPLRSRAALAAGKIVLAICPTSPRTRTSSSGMRRGAALAYDRIHYSEKYSDDNWEYRCVYRDACRALTREACDLAEAVPEEDPQDLLRPRGAGSTADSVGKRVAGDRYHAESRLGALRGPRYAPSTLERELIAAPEPHILLFRREKNYQEKVRRCDTSGAF